MLEPAPVGSSRKFRPELCRYYSAQQRALESHAIFDMLYRIDISVQSLTLRVNYSFIINYKNISVSRYHRACEDRSQHRRVRRRTAQRRCREGGEGRSVPSPCLKMMAFFSTCPRMSGSLMCRTVLSGLVHISQSGRRAESIIRDSSTCGRRHICYRITLHMGHTPRYNDTTYQSVLQSTAPFIN